MSEKLKEVLKGLGKSEVAEEVALKEVASASSLELFSVEQELMNEGFPEEKLKSLCKLHLKVVEDRLEELKNSLEEGHPVKTMIVEHEEILKFLDELDELVVSMEKGISGTNSEAIKELAENLISAGKYHEEKENALFSSFEERGITGPTRILETEHEELKSEKEKLLELSKEPEKNKEEIIVVVNLISARLRDHIYRENNILYPAALQLINGKKEWNKIKISCDKIGYCCFKPGV
jgi:DUF438 domain-containing protein